MKCYYSFVFLLMCVGLVACSSSSADCELYCSKMFQLDAGGAWYCKIIESIDVNGRCRSRDIYRPCEEWYGTGWECNEINQICFNRSLTAERKDKTCVSDEVCNGMPCDIEQGASKGICRVEGLSCSKSVDCLAATNNYICVSNGEDSGVCKPVGHCDNGCVLSKNKASSYDSDKWLWFPIYNPSSEEACMDQCDLNTVGDPMPSTLETQLNQAKGLFDFQQAQMNLQCSISSVEK